MAKWVLAKYMRPQYMYLWLHCFTTTILYMFPPSPQAHVSELSAQAIWVLAQLRALLPNQGTFALLLCGCRRCLIFRRSEMMRSVVVLRKFAKCLRAATMR